MVEPHERLRAARIKAGYANAATAVEAFGWNYPTYTAHENGSRGITKQAAQRYGRALLTDPTWILFGTTAAPQPPAQPRDHATGFSESHLTTFVGKVANKQLLVERFAQDIAPPGVRPYLWTLTTTYADYSLYKNDIIIADPKTAPQNGQIVVVNHADQDTQEAHMLLRRWTPAGLLAPLDQTPDIYRDADMVVMATVIGSLRLAFAP